MAAGATGIGTVARWCMQLGEPCRRAHHGEPGSCGWLSAAAVACRFGEARRRAMPDSSPPGARLHTCLPRSSCWATGPELGLWAGPSPAPAPAKRTRQEAQRGWWHWQREKETDGERGGTPGPPWPQPSGWPRVGMLRCCVCCVCGREPSTLLHPASLPPTLSRSSRPVLQSGSLAVLVPDPCVARSLVSNLPGPPKPSRPSQTSPPSAAPSFPCPPGGSTRLHAGSQGIYLHRQRLATEQGEALAWACPHERTRANEGASHGHTRAGDGRVMGDT